MANAYPSGAALGLTSKY